LEILPEPSRGELFRLKQQISVGTFFIRVGTAYFYKITENYLRFGKILKTNSRE